MPIYEYSCPKCCKTFEEWLKTDDEADSHPCPVCGSPSPRVLSSTSFLLKGGGWFVNHEPAAGSDSGSHTGTASDSASTSSPEAAKPDAGKSSSTAESSTN